MKVLFLFTLFNFINCFAEEKIYTQKEFDEALQERLKKMLPENFVSISKDLIKQENELKLANSRILEQEKELKKTEEMLTVRMQDFKNQQTQILGCLDKNEQKKNERISKLVAMLEGMKPDQASQVLSVHDPDTAVNILSRIEIQKASKIFNLMDKEISARLQKQYLDMKR